MRMDEFDASDEFLIVNQTFNSMMSQIETSFLYELSKYIV